MKLNSLQKDLLGVAAATGLLLLVPAVAMRYSRDVSWGIEDFVAAALLLFLAGAIAVCGIRRLHKPGQKFGLVMLVLTALLVLWAELAVGLFD